MAHATVRAATLDSNDPNAPTQAVSDLREDPEATEAVLQRWLRDSDRVGILPESKAALDVAYARGYAQGLGQAREEALDALRTVVLRVLEARLGEVPDTTIDQIAEAPWATLERWLLELSSPTSDATLSGPDAR